jgi:hypothetical protein
LATPADESVIEGVDDRLFLGTFLVGLVAPRGSHALQPPGAVLGHADTQTVEEAWEARPGRDDADRADDGVRLGDDPARRHGDQIGTRRAGPPNRSDKRFLGGEAFEGEEHVVGGSR